MSAAGASIAPGRNTYLILGLFDAGAGARGKLSR